MSFLLVCRLLNLSHAQLRRIDLVPRSAHSPRYLYTKSNTVDLSMSSRGKRSPSRRGDTADLIGETARIEDLFSFIATFCSAAVATRSIARPRTKETDEPFDQSDILVSRLARGRFTCVHDRTQRDVGARPSDDEAPDLRPWRCDVTRDRYAN